MNPLPSIRCCAVIGATLGFSSLTLLFICCMGGIELRLRSAYPVSVADTLASPSRGRNTSFFRCVGGEGLTSLSAASRRSCHFQSVCLDTKSKDFVYFRDSADAIIPPLFDNGTVFSFPDVLVNLRREETGNVRPFTVRVVDHPIPRDALFSDRTVNVLSYHFWPENFGHALGDDILPIFALLRLFHFHTDDVQIIWGSKCCWLHSESEARRASRFLEFFRSSISRHNFTYLSPDSLIGLDPFSVDHLVHGSSELDLQATTPPVVTDGQYLCFRNLLVGTSRLGMMFDQGRNWDDLVDSIVRKNLRVEVPVPHHQRVLLLEKRGRRRLLNIPELEAFIRTSFVGVEVKVLDPSTLTLEEQLVEAQSATVVFTSCGGISFFAAFLRRGTAAIFVDFYDSNTGASHKMESFIWSYQTRVRDFYYSVRANEVTIEPPGNVTRRSWIDFRNYGSITINPRRAAPLILGALRHVEHEFHMHRSFALNISIEMLG